MKIKGLIDEDFVNYKKPAMFIASSYCTWKCCKDLGVNISTCQNSSLSETTSIDISAEDIFQRYINNPITRAVVIGGLEPIIQINEVVDIIRFFRANNCNDEFIIYTGYYKNEITYEISLLSAYKNIIVKYGRYIPNQKKHFDNILGIYLISDNQYSEKIS